MGGCISNPVGVDPQEHNQATQKQEVLKQAQEKFVVTQQKAGAEVGSTQENRIPDVEKVKQGGEHMILDYKVGRTLGVGGFSTVKLGTNVRTGQKCALKLLNTSGGKMDASTKRQLDRELGAMKNLVHKNVLEMYEVVEQAKYMAGGEEQTAVLIVLELAPGGEMFDYLAFCGQFDIILARTYFVQLMQGIQVCHAKGIAHRDLKPENILLDDRFTLKLADFGLSASKLNLEAGGTKVSYTECGTVSYMAPEMFNNHGYEAKPVDMWASGVILFTMVAGFPPYQQPDKEADWWYNKILRKRFDLFWKAHERTIAFPQSVKDIVEGCFNIEPENRLDVGTVLGLQFCKEEILSEDELYNVMKSKKSQVDKEKKLQREEEDAKYATQNQTGCLDQTTVRAIGDHGDAESDDLPPGGPDSGVFKLHVEGDMSGFGARESPFGGEDEALPLKPEEWDSSLSTITQFETLATPPEVVNRLRVLFQSISGVSLNEANDGLGILHVTLKPTSGEIKFTTQVFKTNKQEGGQPISVVLFTRLEGDPMTYKSVFLQVTHLVDSMLFEK